MTLVEETHLHVATMEAQAMEVIPTVLTEQAMLDPIDLVHQEAKEEDMVTPLRLLTGLQVAVAMEVVVGLVLMETLEQLCLTLIFQKLI